MQAQPIDLSIPDHHKFHVDLALKLHAEGHPKHQCMELLERIATQLHTTCREARSLLYATFCQKEQTGLTQPAMTSIICGLVYLLQNPKATVADHHEYWVTYKYFLGYRWWPEKGEKLLPYMQPYVYLNPADQTTTQIMYLTAKALLETHNVRTMFDFEDVFGHYLER